MLPSRQVAATSTCEGTSLVPLMIRIADASFICPSAKGMLAMSGHGESKPDTSLILMEISDGLDIAARGIKRKNARKRRIKAFPSDKDFFFIKTPFIDQLIINASS